MEWRETTKEREGIPESSGMQAKIERKECKCENFRVRAVEGFSGSEADNKKELEWIG